jgi:hypothetical protein
MTSSAIKPISIRSSVPLPAEFEARIRAQLAHHLGHDATSIQRGTVRFEDANGPKGGIDKICRIKLVLAGRPSVFAEKRDTSVGRAFALAVQSIGVAVARGHDKRVSERLGTGRNRKLRTRRAAGSQPGGLD